MPVECEAEHDRSEGAPFRRLRQLAIVERCHLPASVHHVPFNEYPIFCVKTGMERSGAWRHAPANLDEDGLDAAGAGPVGEDGELRGIDLAVRLVDEGEVDARDELDEGGLLGVGRAADDPEAVDAVLVHRLRATHAQAERSRSAAGAWGGRGDVRGLGQ